MSNEWPVVNPVVDGSTKFSSGDFYTKTIVPLETRTNTLNTLINNMSGNTGYLMPVTGLTNNLTVGMFIAQNPNWGTASNPTYIPASAEWNEVWDNSGIAVPSYKAFVLGLLVMKNGTSGVLLCNGWTDDSAVITAALNNISPSAGEYYLSSDNSGKGIIRTSKPNSFCVHLGTYIAANTGTSGVGRLFVNPQAPEYGGHTHNKQEITPAGWIAGTPSQSITAQYYKQLSTAVAAENAIINMIINNSSTVISVDGVIKNTADCGLCKVSTNYYLWVNYTPTAGSKYIIFATNPVSEHENIVNSIALKNGCTLLSLDKEGGNIFLGLNESISSSNNLTGTCVTALKNTGIETGPVVHNITAGVGVVIEPITNSPGCYSIKTNTGCETYIDFNVVNIDGALIGSSESRISYVFPASTQSSVTGSFRVPYHNSSNQTGTFRLIFKGNTASSVVNMAVKIQAMPTVGNPVAIAETYTYNGSVNTSNINNYYALDITCNHHMPANALITATISSNTTNRMELLSASLLLNASIADAAGTTPGSGNTLMASAVGITDEHGYYEGTTVQSALENLGAALMAIENQIGSSSSSSN